MIVIDASVVVAILQVRNAVERFTEIAPGEEIIAPHLLDVEVLHALRKQLRLGLIDAEQARVALDDLSHLTIERYPHTPFLTRMWELRQNVTAYDATYVAMAEALNIPLFTRDNRLARSTGHRARINYIA